MNLWFFASPDIGQNRDIEGCFALPDKRTPAQLFGSKNAPQIAALIGLDGTTAETIGLILEILGWTVLVSENVEEVSKQRLRLVFVDQHHLLSNQSVFVDSENSLVAVVVVGASSIPHNFDNQNVKLFVLSRPLDIAQVEEIISEC